MQRKKLAILNPIKTYEYLRRLLNRNTLYNKTNSTVALIYKFPAGKIFATLLLTANTTQASELNHPPLSDFFSGQT